MQKQTNLLNLNHSRHGNLTATMIGSHHSHYQLWTDNGYGMSQYKNGLDNFRKFPTIG